MPIGWFGIHPPTEGAWGRLKNIERVVAEAEELGFGAAATRDHILYSERLHKGHSIMPPKEYLDDEAMVPNKFESIVTLTYMAARTKKMLVMPDIMLIALRNPIVLAKEFATLDTVSNGRTILGVGTGNVDHMDEWKQLGIPYAERGKMTDEYIRVMKELWTSSDASFHGRYVNFDGLTMFPKPVQKGGPPILIGGYGKRALTRVAELGDGWLPAQLGSHPVCDPEGLSERLPLLRDLARDYGRRGKSFVVAPVLSTCVAKTDEEAKRVANMLLPSHTTWSERYHEPLDKMAKFFVGEPSTLVKHLDRWVNAGMTHCWLYFNYLNVENLLEQMRIFAREVMPSFVSTG